MRKPEIIWSNQAKLALKDIFDYYKDKSLKTAKNIKSELLNSPKTVLFSRQYQIDDINPKFRRIVVRHYKVLYQERNGIIEVIDIISTRQSPELLEDL
jgi:plasmid stabilization system protein ParE